jgi:hypothetical protein
LAEAVALPTLETKLSEGEYAVAKALGDRPRDVWRPPCEKSAARRGQTSIESSYSKPKVA